MGFLAEGNGGFVYLIIEDIVLEKRSRFVVIGGIGNAVRSFKQVRRKGRCERSSPDEIKLLSDSYGPICSLFPWFVQ